MDENSLLNQEQIKMGIHESWDKAAQGWNEQTPRIHQWLAGSSLPARWIIQFELAWPYQ
ncbi:hypothetical protein H0A66_05490 [Alcaligenaceae bacterium]|nr:hypothetical protein [Alcaligenaceae bacterium]